MASVTIREIHKNYGAVPVLRGVSLAIADGEFAVLVGPSGCGKSTLLRMVAGLEDIGSGEISIGGRVVNDLPPRSRDISMVFQNYALYPHMTVADNLAFALRLVKMPEAEVQQRTGVAAQMLGLTPLLERLPRQLSGGQRQRVAMGRAIVRQPQAFLFDEPLSNLDAKLRVTMRTEIKALHQRLRTTSIYVTHDQVEAMTMADRIVVLHDGRIAQQGTPLEVYDDPDNTFVAQFIGSPAMNMLPCTVQAGALAIGADTLRAAVSGLRDGRSLIAGVRPEHWLPVSEGGVAGRIKVIEPTGADTLVYLDVAGHEVCAQLRERFPLRVDEVMRLAVAPERAFLFDPETGQRIRSS